MTPTDTRALIVQELKNPSNSKEAKKLLRLLDRLVKILDKP